MAEKNIKTKEAPKAANRQTLSGIVVSDKMTDTVVVKVVRFEKNPKYHKYQKISKKYKAHDPGNTKKIGDKASIESCRPISKDKNFKVIA